MDSKEILKNVPKPTKSYINEVNQLFTPYLFFTEDKFGNRNFICSCCNKKFRLNRLSRTMTDVDFNLLSLHHRDNIVCPDCKRYCTAINIKKAGKCNIISHEIIRTAWFVPVNENLVYIIASENWKDYKVEDKTEALKECVDSIYCITPDETKYFRTGLCGILCEDKNLKEPFFRNMAGYMNYSRIDFYKIKNTFLKYSALEEYEKKYPYNSYPIKYLSLYPTHKAMEMLVKLGLESIVIDLVNNNIKNVRLVNWSGKNAVEILRCKNKQEFNEIRKCEPTLMSLINYRELYNFRHSLPDIKNYFTDIFLTRSYQMTDYCIKFNIDPVEAGKYVNKQLKKAKSEIGCGQAAYGFDGLVSECYVEYISMAAEINFDMTQEVIKFPKDLSKSHDTVTDIYNERRRLKNEQLFAERARQEKEELEKTKKRLSDDITKYANLLKKYKKKFAFSDGVYQIIVPETMDDIIQEGQQQRNCVASYAVRHIRGDTIILFMRRVDKPDMSLYTIEVSDNTCWQFRGYANGTKFTHNQAEFIRKWFDFCKIKKGNQPDCDLKEEEKRYAAISAA